MPVELLADRCTSCLLYELWTYHRLDVRVRYGIELDVFGLVRRAKVDERALVLCGVAVSGRREDSDTVTGVLDFVALHAHFVTADDSFETVRLAEALGDIWAKLETDTTLGGSATGHSLRIGP